VKVVKSRDKVCVSVPSIHQWLYSPLLGHGRFFHFRNPVRSRCDSLDRGSARRKAVTCTQGNTNTGKQQHTFMSRVGFEPMASKFEWAKTVGVSDGAAIAMSYSVQVRNVLRFFFFGGGGVVRPQLES
jgi:hypothetical protein